MSKQLDGQSLLIMVVLAIISFSNLLFSNASSEISGIYAFKGNASNLRIFLLILVMAALVAGIFWGWMYYRFRSVAANVVSHVVWDIVIFLIIPIS